MTNFKNMNIAIYCSLSIFFGMSVMAQSEDVERLRRNYPLATRDENICKTEIEQIKNVKPTGALDMAYHGVYHMLWAKYLSAPLSKLNSFKTGKKLMETALKKRYGDPEIHFLRLTIQQHAPGILKYNKNIQEDIAQITKRWDTITSIPLKEQIKEFLVSNKLLNHTELKKLAI